MNKAVATAIGFSAILMWAFLALLTTAAGNVPPFQLVAMNFTIATLSIVLTWPFRSGVTRSLKQPWQVWLLGCSGLCLYHCLYFFAVQNAPPVEASLIAYLWPLLIVVFAAFLPGERLRIHHMLGAALGLAGAVLIISRGGAINLSDSVKPGHIAALACAFVWSGYSVLSRRYGDTPPDVVAGFCAVTAVTALFIHLGFETTVMPELPLQWLAIVLLGALPLGAGFFTWDFGMKKGDIMVLGAASYAAPLLSTLVLLASGIASWHWSTGMACLLITLGALIAAKDMILRKRMPA